MMPVRLEVRYDTRTGQTIDGTFVDIPVLRVRIYPDEISIAAVAPGLTNSERVAGQAFWTAQTDPAGSDNSRRGAWEVLVRQVGRPRVAAVARDTRPDAGPTPNRVSTPPTAHLLPDSWIVVAEYGDQQFVQHVPRPGADPQVGPAAGSTFVPADARLVGHDDPLRWLVDFDAAVASGMATVIDLATPDQVDAGSVGTDPPPDVDRVLVVGVRDANPDRSGASEAAALENLLSAHALDDRLALLAPGTPTNNQTDRPSGFTSASNVFDGYEQAVGLAPAAAGSPAPAGPDDATVLEAALSLTAGALAGIDGADRRDQWWAGRMQVALFPVCLGELVNQLQLPQLGSASLTDLRAAMVKFVQYRKRTVPLLRSYLDLHVRARGPVPTLRIGRQPYGVLPIMPTDHWARIDGESDLTDGLLGWLRYLRTFFDTAATAVPSVGVGDPDAALLRILGQGPVPHPGAYRVWRADGPLDNALDNPPDPGGGGLPTAPATGATASSTLAAAAAQLAVSPELIGQVRRFGVQELLAAAAPVAKGTTSTTLQWLDGWAGPSTVMVPVATSDQARGVWATPADYLGRLAAGLDSVTPTGPDASRPPELLFLLAEHALAVAADADTHVPESGLLASTQGALNALAAAELTDDEWTRLTGETLACSANRLDAWFTSIATQRLSALRVSGAQGIQLGAWGVLLDVKPGAASTPPAPPAGWAGTAQAAASAGQLRAPVNQVGYVHAPSLSQATTAGVLRAGERAHRGDGSSLASIDLTSRRIRVGTGLVEAMSNGQPLGALLGYRLERMLGDATMHAELAQLRARYPQRRQDDSAAPQAGNDHVVPDALVDGLEVLNDRTNAAILVRRSTDPTFAAILDELQTNVDAVADLLVAEGVHQITSGRSEAAGATFQAVAEGLQPPEVTVTREPRSGITLTHRTVQVVGPDGPAVLGWADRPRGRLAPFVELWARRALGPAAQWTVAGIGLDVVGVCALDVVAESSSPDGLTLLTHRIAAAGSGDVVAVSADPDFARLTALAQAVGDVLATARPATAGDLSEAPEQANTVDAGTVRARGGPDAASLQPLAAASAAELDAIQAAVEAVLNAATGHGPGAQLDSALLTPFARLGVSATVPVPTLPTAPIATVVAAASAAAAILRDADAEIATAVGLAVTAGAPAPPGTASRSVRLATACLSPTALASLVRLCRRIGGNQVVPTIAAASQLSDRRVTTASTRSLSGWVSRTGRVRGALAALDDLRLFVAAEGRVPDAMQAAQFPLVPAEGWLGGELAERTLGPEDNVLRRWIRPDGPRVHIVAAGSSGAIDAPTLHALVVDEFAEVLPSPTVTTGLAVHYDAPGARPPQAVLLAVHPAPVAQTWTWQLLIDTAKEALALARMRGVDLDDLAVSGLYDDLPFTYVRDVPPPAVPMSILTEEIDFSQAIRAANRFAHGGN